MDRGQILCQSTSGLTRLKSFNSLQEALQLVCHIASQYRLSMRTVIQRNLRYPPSTLVKRLMVWPIQYTSALTKSKKKFQCNGKPLKVKVGVQSSGMSYIATMALATSYRLKLMAWTIPTRVSPLKRLIYRLPE